MQVFNETEALYGVYRSESEVRQRELAKTRPNNSPYLVASLPQGMDDLSKGKTREKLSEVTGVPQKKLETSMTSSYNVNLLLFRKKFKQWSRNVLITEFSFNFMLYRFREIRFTVRASILWSIGIPAPLVNQTGIT